MLLLRTNLFCLSFVWTLAEPSSYKIAKAYAAVQSLKRKYQIEDGDPDMLIVKEFLSALSTGTSSGGENKPRSQSNKGGGGNDPGYTGLDWGAWKHDVNYVTENLESGLPGLEKEVKDTMYNIEHITQRNSATNLMRGILGFGAIYLIVGSAMKYNMEGARGIDMLPHIGFWMEYPKLVMDGVQYSKMIAYTYMGQSPGGISYSGSAGFTEIGAERDTFSTFQPSKEARHGPL